MSHDAEPFIAARDQLLRLGEDNDAAVREFCWPAMDRFNWALNYFDHLLGAVISPATILLTEADVRDRFERGHIRHAIVDASLTGRFANLAGNFTRIVVGGTPGWHRFEDAYGAARPLFPMARLGRTDPLMVYFTSGTTAKPKLVLHSHQSYPVGLLSAMYCFGPQPGDIQLGIASPGWAAHMYGLFAGWNAGTAIAALAQPRFDARKALDVLRRCGVTVFWGSPTVWRHADPRGVAPETGRAARRALGRRAAQPPKSSSMWSAPGV